MSSNTYWRYSYRSFEAHSYPQCFLHPFIVWCIFAKANVVPYTEAPKEGIKVRRVGLISRKLAPRGLAVWWTIAIPVMSVRKITAHVNARITKGKTLDCPCTNWYGVFDSLELYGIQRIEVALLPNTSSSFTGFTVSRTTQTLRVPLRLLLYTRITPVYVLGRS